MAGRTRKHAVTEGIVAGVLFGTAAVFIRFVQGLDSFSIVFWRLVVASLGLGVLLVVLRRSFSLRLFRENFRDLLMLSFFLCLHFIFFTAAVRDTTILNATVLVNTAPLFSLLVSVAVFKVKPSKFALAGMTVSLIGVCIITIGEMFGANSSSQVASPSLVGDFEAILAAFVEAFYLNYGGRMRLKMGVVSAMLPIYLLTAVLVLALSIPAQQAVSLLPFDFKVWLPLLGLGLVPTAVSHTLYYSSLLGLKSFEAATLALLEPIGATVIGLVVFHEVPMPVFVLGAVLVLAGVVFVVRDKG